MKSTATWLSLSIALVLLTASFANSQDKDNLHKPPIMVELHQELHEYVGTQYLQTLNSWQKTIDATLTAEDLAELNELRAEAAEMMGMIREHLQERAGRLTREEREAKRAERKARVKSLIDKPKKNYVLMAKVISIAEKYPELLEQLKADREARIASAKPAALQIVHAWERDNATAIAAADERTQRRLEIMKYKLGDENAEMPERPERPDRADRSDRADRPDRPDGSDRPDRADRPDRLDREDARRERAERRDGPEGQERRRHREHRRKRHAKHGGIVPQLESFHSVSRIFLWNGSAEMIDGSSMPYFHDQNAANADLDSDAQLLQKLGVEAANIGVYPNPASVQATISIDLPADDTVILYLFDTSGREIARLYEGTLTAGQHDFQVDALKLNLNSGVYHYRLAGRTAAQNGQLVISR